MRDIGFLGLLLCMLPLSLISPLNAILVWAWASMVYPNAQLYGAIAHLPYQKVFAGIALLLFFAGTIRRRFHLDLPLILMIVFLVLMTLSEVLSPWSNPRGWDIQGNVMKVVVLALLVSWALTDRFSIHALLLAICIGLAYGAVLDGVLFFLSGGHHWARIGPTGADNNTYCLFLDMSIPLFYYLSRQSAGKPLRYAFLGACFLAAAAAVATHSRGGFIGLVVIGIAASLFSRRRVASLLVMAVVAGVFALTVPKSWTERMHTIRTAKQDSSFMDRVMSWKMSTLIALDRPWIGAGPYAVEYPPVWHHYSLEFDRLDFIPSETPGNFAFAAHSIYFEVLGDTGFPGLLTFLLMICGTFLNTRRIRRMSRDRPELGWAYHLARAMELSLMVLLISGAALSAAYFELNFLLVGMASALRRQLAVQRQTGAHGSLQRAGGAGLGAAHARRLGATRP